MPAADDTICAIATPPGEGGVGIVRLSGPDCLEVARAVFRPARLGAGLRSHHMVYGSLYQPISGLLLDEALVCFMAGPRSYTGEDVIEFHCHGSPVVLQAVLASCLELGARAAERGEFTLRAFLNGRLDLAQAEAVVDIVRARTASAAQVAAQGLTGALGRRIDPIFHALAGTLAYLEATIDFVEEGLPEQTAPLLAGTIVSARASIAELLKRASHGALLRDGVRVVLTGKPNVGKSSLLNTLLRRDRAIVTPIAGTTRDTLEELLDIHGIPIYLIDTAGLAETENQIVRIGIERTITALQSAAIVVFVLDGSMALDSADLDAAELLRSHAAQAPVLVVKNKSDLRDMIGDQYATLFSREWQPTRVVRCSALQPESVIALEDALADLALGGEALNAEDTLVENTRQAEALRLAAAALATAEQGLASGMLPELICIDLRSALEALGSVTGIDMQEVVLDRIFSDFCIGK